MSIPKAWWRLFLVELPLVAGTVLFALLAPEAFCRQAFGIDAVTGPVLALVHSYVSVVATLVFWFYARVLFSPRIDLPTFRLYQEALLVGDVGIVVLWSAAIARGLGGPAAFAGIALAGLWGLVRVVFLMRVREPSSGAT